MELYAGMVDNLDHNVGRLLSYLESIGELDNTLIVFMSDDGAAAEDFYHHKDYGPFIREHFNEDYDRMGKADSFISYGPQWAEAGSAPFRFFKGYTTEGGMIAPLIISGPRVSGNNKTSHEFLTLMDLAPTFYELGGAHYPDQYHGKKTYALRGTSLLPYLGGFTSRVHGSDYVFGIEHANFAMLRKGDWKITNVERPFEKMNFKLYWVSEDLAELNDLKEAEPEKFSELLAEWESFYGEVGIQVPVPE